MTDIRNSQTVAYVGVAQTTPAIRNSQTVAYAGFGLAPPIRATQIVAYIGTPNLLAPCLTQRAFLWTITRSDGIVFRFTSHDKNVNVLGETFTPCNSLSSSALEISAQMDETDNVDITGIISDDAVNEADLFAGLFDGSIVEVSEVDWTPSPVEVTLLAKGTTGKLQQSDSGYKFEVVTDSQKLQTKSLLDQVTPSCRWILGSPNVSGNAGCGIDLSTFEVSGSVTGIASPDTYNQSQRRVFSDSTRAEADDFFKLGNVTWTSGPNTGITSEVKDFASGQFTLWPELKADIKIGDAYTATPGCNKLIGGDCLTKFNNVVNHGGFPFLPGRDFLTKRADK